MLTCSRCRERKSDEEFHRHGTSTRGRQYYCRGCMRAINAAWYAEHRDTRRLQSAQTNAKRRQAYAAKKQMESQT